MSFQHLVNFIGSVPDNIQRHRFEGFSSNLLKFTIPIARSGSQLSWVLTSDPSLIWNTEVDLLLPVIHSELWKHLIKKGSLRLHVSTAVMV